MIAMRGAGRTPSLVLAAAMAVGLQSTGFAQNPLSTETFDAVWRTVRDSHFDSTFNGVDWERVGRELRPTAAGAATPGQLRAVLQDMLGRLGQSHFAIIPGSADRVADAPRDAGGSLGFDVRLIGDSLVVTELDSVGSAAAAGVQPGWKVLSVDGTEMRSVLTPLLESLNPRLLAVEAWRAAQMRLRGPAGSRARVAFEGADRTPVTLELQRVPERGEAVTVGSLPTMFVRVASEGRHTPGGRTAGLIRFNVWMTAVDPLFAKAVDDFREADGIIVDLRGNPGGLAAMLMGISGHFIDERRALGVMKMREGEQLQFNVNPRRVNARGDRVAPFSGPVAILVDALTGSASECFAGGMQSLGRARVFGQPSMGQALPALFARLPNGDVLIYAYGDFVTADGTRLEGRGVIPDAIVPLDRGQLLAGRDRPLDAALAWIDTVDRTAGTRTGQ